ncbi:hypothetical protein [Streptomyces sp. 184]|uniref:hypothetical protein n=1 Tax=Streptomyces sp. 184 TaxID=1827526 RepID=UPI00389189C8
MSGDESVISALATAYDDRDAGKVFCALGALAEPADLARRPALWHPLGFFRLELARDHLRRRYVLHCWPRGERRTREPAWAVHRHAFALESLVVEGEIRDRRFGGAAAGRAALRGPLYRAEGVGRQSALKRTEDIAELDEAEDRSFGTGSFYAVPPARFHESRVETSGFCVTLARMSPKHRPDGHVLGGFASPPVLVYRHTPVAKGLLTHLADRIRAA